MAFEDIDRNLFLLFEISRAKVTDGFPLDSLESFSIIGGFLAESPTQDDQAFTPMSHCLLQFFPRALLTEMIG